MTLHMDSVCVDINGHQILDNISFEVGRGDWLTVIGPNGAGKSTLLRTAAGGAATGDVTVMGHHIGRLDARARARLVALVPQRATIPVDVAVVDYTLWGRTPHLPYLGREGSTDLGVVSEILDGVNMGGLAQRRLGTLSGGELQRTILARALAQEAPVLLLDEPTTALDIGHQQQVLQLVDSLRRERSLTVVSAMHDLTLAGQYTDRLILLSQGSIAAEGTPAQVLGADLLSEHYGAPVRVLTDPEFGPIVLPASAC